MSASNLGTPKYKIYQILKIYEILQNKSGALESVGVPSPSTVCTQSLQQSCAAARGPTGSARGRPRRWGRARR